MTSFIAYLALAFLAAAFLSSRTDRKFFSFIIYFWIFSQPILNSVLMIKVPGLGFDLHPNRIMLVLLVPYLLFLSNRNTTNIKRPPFEKYILIYLIVVFSSLAYNFDVIHKQNLAAVPLEIFMFLIFYLAAKRCATASFFDGLIKAVLMMGIASACISFVQVLGDGSFLKTCNPRMAFGHVVRSSGIFQSEYELGYFQILAVIITVYKLKNSFWKLPLIGLFIGSLLTTFHRLDVLILITCFFTYTWFFSKSSQKTATYLACFFVAFIAFSTYKMVESDISNTEFVKGRLKEDTVSGRIDQYKLILTSISKFFWVGMGDYTNKEYFEFMADAGMVYTVDAGTDAWHQVPYAVHNGYLEVCALYGVFAMIAFIALLTSMYRYYKKMLFSEALNARLPFFTLLVWMLANISNGVSQFGLYYVLLLGLISGSVVSMQRLMPPEKS